MAHLANVCRRYLSIECWLRGVGAIQVLLREYCKFPVEMGLVGDAFIDTACLDVPKVRFQG